MERRRRIDRALDDCDVPEATHEVAQQLLTDGWGGSEEDLIQAAIDLGPDDLAGDTALPAV